MRVPAVAGYFYPSDRKELERMLTAFFEKARKEVKERENVIGIIVPHAGYIYSGLTAAYAYASLPKNPKKTIVIIGPNHTGYGSEVSVYPNGKWKTPLGEIEVDEDFVDELIKDCKLAEKDEAAHIYEHSIEVQLPFLQFLYGNNFKIVPICLMNQSLEVAERLANALIKIKKEFLVVASSDLNHYESYDVTQKKDMELIKAIISLDLKNFYQTLEKLNVSACGYGAIATLMSLTKKLDGKIELLRHSTSAEVSKDYLNVVGYGALIALH
jgi:AmmeMemoRadiSam system protein B